MIDESSGQVTFTFATDDELAGRIQQVENALRELVCELRAIRELLRSHP